MHPLFGMQDFEKLLNDSLEDFALTRAERRELKPHIAELQDDTIGLAKVRSLAFKLATNAMEEVGEITAMDWLQGVIKLLYSRENAVKASAYFSPGDDCLNRIRRLISSAQKSLDLCVFTITDNRIVEKIEQAVARKVKVRVISDDLKSEDLGSDLERMEKAGIACLYDRTSAHMHHKFAVADGDLLLTGSYNWTRSAASENNENIVVTNNRKLVTKFQQEFERLWKLLS